MDPGSFAAVAHLAPGLRRLGVYLDNLGADAPSVIASLTALESLALFADPATDEFGDDGPMPPAQVDQVRVMLPHIIVG